MAETIKVHGYRELLKAVAKADKDTKREMRQAFRKVGDIVRADAAHRFAGIDARSAAGYKVRVRQRGVAVEQSLRRTTGAHPEYGTLQLKRALEPAVDANQTEVILEFERALDTMADRFNHEGLL